MVNGWIWRWTIACTGNFSKNISLPESDETESWKKKKRIPIK